jgi:hypothetical protein
MANPFRYFNSSPEVIRLGTLFVGKMRRKQAQRMRAQTNSAGSSRCEFAIDSQSNDR